jgi:hypothetical protein
VVGDTVRCLWHRACFSVLTGEALRAPALDPVTCWKVETGGGKLFVREKQPEKKRATGSARAPENVIIVGGGATDNAAAEMLRREGHCDGVTIMSAEDAVPYDRPHLSKDFLAGTASAESIPLRSMDFYRGHEIDVGPYEFTGQGGRYPIGPSLRFMICTVKRQIETYAALVAVQRAESESPVDAALVIAERSSGVRTSPVAQDHTCVKVS